MIMIEISPDFEFSDLLTNNSLFWMLVDGLIDPPISIF